MDHLLHIPLCVRESRGSIHVPAMRRIAVERRKDADPVGCRIPTDARLLRYRGPAGGVKRVALTGYCLMEALEDRWPDFHMSVVNGRILLTGGTSIYVTGRTRGGGETLAVTWDYGESVNQPIRRLNRLRRLLTELPDEVAYRIMSADLTPDLPPPQALLSDVIGVDERDPDTALAGCGGSAPMSIAVGVRTTHFVFDHRLVDPDHFQPLVTTYQRYLSEALDNQLDVRRGVDAA